MGRPKKLTEDQVKVIMEMRAQRAEIIKEIRVLENKTRDLCAKHKRLRLVDIAAELDVDPRTVSRYLKR